MKILLLLAVFALAAPVQAAPGVMVVDDEGRELRLETPPLRIVSLAPHATELLFAAGLGERIVGAVEYSDWPAAARSIPRVGRFDRLDIERILALEPDLVVVWGSGTPRTERRRLRELGLPLFVSEPRELADVPRTLERFDKLAADPAQARQAAADFRKRIANLAESYGDRRKVAVFYQIWDRPMVTVGGGHLISRVLELCGGINVFGDLGALAPTVSVEAVVVADPEVIIASGADNRRPPWLDGWQRWEGMRAVRDGHLYFVPPDLLHRHTPRLADGAARVCRLIDRARDR